MNTKSTMFECFQFKIQLQRCSHTELDSSLISMFSKSLFEFSFPFFFFFFLDLKKIFKIKFNFENLYFQYILFVYIISCLLALLLILSHRITVCIFIKTNITTYILKAFLWLLKLGPELTNRC